jgi:hypothetical protein
MFDGARFGGETYLNTGALVWFIGFLVYYRRPEVVSVRGAGYVYGALALIGGVFIGVGLTRVDLSGRWSGGSATTSRD